MRGILVLLLLLPVLAQAQQQPFEAVVSGSEANGCFIIPIVISRLQWLTPDRVDSTDIGAIASADHQRVFGTVIASPLGLRIVELHPDGSRTPFYDGPPASFPTDLAVAPNGRVVARSLANVAVISPAGVLEATYVLPGAGPGGGAIALANDNCTLLYSNGSGVKRFDVCTGTPLSDFAVTPAIDIEGLPNGQVLIATGDQVVLFASTGAPVRVVADLAQYGLSDLTAEQAALDPSGTVLYVAAMAGCDRDPNLLLRVSFADGTLLSSRDLEINRATGLVVGTGVPAPVPAAGTLALLALAITLAFAAVSALRRLEI